MIKKNQKYPLSEIEYLMIIELLSIIGLAIRMRILKGLIRHMLNKNRNHPQFWRLWIANSYSYFIMTSFVWLFCNMLNDTAIETPYVKFRPKTSIILFHFLLIKRPNKTHRVLKSDTNPTYNPGLGCVLGFQPWWKNTINT